MTLAAVRRWTPGLVMVGVLAVYGLWLARPIDLTTADVGRHVRNGQLYVKLGRPVSTNFYSYTDPGRGVVNHHWASGALFYLVWKAAGFTGLHAVFLLVSLATLLVLLRLARWRAGPGLAGLLCVCLIPLFVQRSEIRPEVFSYLFAAIMVDRLWRVRDGGLSPRALWWLPVIELAWVNLHIYFFLGPALIGAFLLEAIASGEGRRLAPKLMAVLAATVAVTVVNPYGLAGAAAPWRIFEEYGYRLVENQPVWFLERLMSNPNFLLFKVVCVALLVSFVLAWVHGRRRILTAETLIAVGVSGMAWWQLRNFTLFGLLILPILAGNLRAAFGPALERRRAGWELAAVTALIVMGGLAIAPVPLSWSPARRGPLGLGVEAGSGAAAEFIRDEGLAGPILNNYDVGGYLIYHLFPQHRVFVDNRPEAYSASFFQDVYIPLQQDEAVWRRMEERYRFNAIVFQRRDFTPWAQPFLIRRIQDPDWAPVFVDRRILILLKRSPRNARVIDRYELPPAMFRVEPTQS